MTDITKDRWYIELQERKAEREQEKLESTIAKEFAGFTYKPTRRLKPSAPQTFKPSQTISQMQAESMKRLQRRADSQPWLIRKESI